MCFDAVARCFVVETSVGGEASVCPLRFIVGVDGGIEVRGAEYSPCKHVVLMGSFVDFCSVFKVRFG